MQLSDSARCLLLIERDIPEAQALLAEAVQLVGARASELLNISWARGLMHSFLGETDRAMDSLQRALQQAARDQSHWEEYTCLANLITTALDGDRAPLALAHCDRLRQVAAKMIGGSEPQVAAALEALARAGCGEGEAADLDRVAAEVRKVDAKNMLAYTLNAAAELDLRAGNREQARRRATEALAAATAVGRPSQIAGAHAVLGRIALLDGDARAAQAHLDATDLHRRQPLVLAAHARARLDELEDLLSRRSTQRAARGRASTAS
jgi:tetratricopeptide (TPR) repeat protein